MSFRKRIFEIDLLYLTIFIKLRLINIILFILSNKNVRRYEYLNSNHFILHINIHRKS